VAFSFPECERVSLIDALHANNPHTEDDLNGSAHNAVSSFSPAELRRAMNNVLEATRVCKPKVTISSTLSFKYGVYKSNNEYNALEYSAWATACGKLE
jgi:hypothetical protein